MRGLLAVLVLAVILTGVVGASVPDRGDGGSASATAQQAPEAVVQDLDAEDVLMEVRLGSDGSARWQIEHRIRLDDDNETSGFEATREQIESDPSSFRDPFADRVRAMASRAERETGRVMVVENVTVEAYREQIPQEYGVVVYEFTWYGFAESDDKLRVGDSLSGLFLDEKTTMLVSWPDETSVTEVSPEPDERREESVLWTGPFDFADGEPTIVLESDSTTFGPDFSVDAWTDDVLLTAGVLTLFFVGLVGSVVALRRHRPETEPVESDDETAAEKPESDRTGDTSEGGSQSDSRDADGVPDGERDTSETPRDGTDSIENTVETPSDGAGRQGSAEGTPAYDDELLSNEERVLALLDERGGRVKQQEVVEVLDWSETKTSEVVSVLREGERIEVYRLGRENVLALPEVGIEPKSDDDNGGDGR